MNRGTKTPRTAVVTNDQARRLFLCGHGLCGDPLKRRVSTPAHAMKTIRLLGFVQVDSINVVERAHHHILWTRDHGYRPAHLDNLQRHGLVFEHWTHDASMIPIESFPHWKHRFDRVAWSKWFQSQLGESKEQLLASVRTRIHHEGPLMARDFGMAEGARAGTWWEWKPAKAALEYLWRRGELSIVRREGFQKVYDLTHRALPEAHAADAPELGAHLDWLCTSALERLGVATPTEIARFWNSITLVQARDWCRTAEGRGLAARVMLDDAGKQRLVYARADWRTVLRRGAVPHGGTRLLSPFDPIVRDRARAKRLFGFDYRFEAFVPQPKRKYGYYVLPILSNEQLVGRLDPEFDRASGVLHVRAVWWEPGTRAADGLRQLAPALDRYAEFLGASRWTIGAPRPRKSAGGA